MTINEDRKNFFSTVLGVNGSLQDLEKRWLKARVTPYVGSIPDMWRKYLGENMDGVAKLPYPLNRGQGVRYEAESVALFARFSTQPTTARKYLIDKLIKDLKAAGVWNKLDAFYVMAAHTAQAAQRNWKSSSNNLSPVSSPTFVADQGYTGNGTTSYLTTGLELSTATNYLLNSGHLAVWSRTNSQEASSLSIGARTTSTTNQATMLLRNGSDLGHARMNQNVNPTGGAVADSRGFFVGSRQASNSNILYRNGVQVNATTDVSTAKPAFAAYIGAINTGGTAGAFSARQHSVASIGAGLSAAETLAFYNAVNAYMVQIGAA